MDATDQASRKPQGLQGGDDDKNEIVPLSSDDRLSSLPDSVLCHVLSFLKTELSVATSILARRWRFLWKDVPNLDFGFDFFLKHRKEKFRCAKIISRVMRLRNARNINTFSICSSDEHFSNRDLDKWLKTAIARNVQILDLGPMDHYLPTCIYTCKTLVELRLFSLKSLCGAVCLPQLRKLFLVDVYLDQLDDTTLHDLIYGCPVLEELKIFVDHPFTSIHGEISSTTIKRLTLEVHGTIEGDGEEGDYSSHEVEINIPGLRYLLVEQYVETPFLNFTAATLNDIVEANVSQGDDLLCSQSFILFIERLCQVKSLRLSCNFTKFLDADFAAATSRFHKLTKLELAADWRFLIKFLGSADNLEILIINEVAWWSEEKLKCWMEPQHVPACLSSSLRHVKIDPFRCLENEFKMVSYILGNAKVMKTMKIRAKHLDNDSKVELDALKRISMFEKASETCRIEFH